MLCAGCQPVRPPPPSHILDGLPISGSLADARGAGFTDCLHMDAVSMRCRRHGVMLAGQGPYEAAVDLAGSEGRRGFRQLTLWHDWDQNAVYNITETLKKRGWRYCYVGTDHRGDYAIFTHRGTSAFISMDLSYWGKRRLRVIPGWNRKELRCVPA